MLDLRTFRLDVGDEHRQALDITVEPFTVGYEVYVPTQTPVPGEVRVTRLRSGLLFRLRVAVTVEGPCHRCLEPAQVLLQIDDEEYQANQPEPGAEDDMTCEYLGDDVLDVDRWASDEAVLAMPTTVLCREDCLGLCPTCGADLNQGPCGCVTEVSDERWSELRKLL